ncbi:xanthine dehydrogenase accessory factor [Cognatiyoonia koreensis]|uniref:Xanthine dehydrogenase accessory factor n=1 Tax=Cognatiyoonia koreensis TaxID=364200 RepID=A0A1I0PRZ6_9RHOB|nr:XdhC family protein [Cognatiyoonia koreensis]SEW17112.1 xanthine dehydrogenase accessory factor [Cognatiyoonia koreensis]
MTPDHLLPLTALDWHRAGRKVAVAIVVETWGSAPRAVGSWLVIDEDGTMAGSVSGGCVEGAVITEALEAMADGRSRLLDYGVSDDEAFAVGLACGGRIRVLVDPVGSVMPVDLLEALATRQPIAYVAAIGGTDRETAQPADYPDRFRFDRSGLSEDEKTYVGVHNPPLRMIVVGAVHIAQTLVQCARSCGFAPILIDPRGAFGSAARFPDETILDGWPDEEMAALKPDARTAVVTLTHDPKLDDPAIMAALKSDVFYLGCLGSTRTHAKRVARLKEAGFTEAQIARIHAPVGLDIGGRAPAEIAISIMAEVIESLRKAA